MTEPTRFLHVQSCNEHVRFRAGCPACQERGRRYENMRKLRGAPSSAPADLTAQRIRELRHSGYTIDALAAETGLGTMTIKRLGRGDNKFLQLRVYHAVEAAYVRLRGLPGPSKAATRWAVRNGWAAPEPLPMPELIPEDQVDMVAVQRAIAGEKVPLTRAEALVAWGQLETQGLPRHTIAVRLHMSAKTIDRWRERLTA